MRILAAFLSFTVFLFLLAGCAGDRSPRLQPSDGADSAQNTDNVLFVPFDANLVQLIKDRSNIKVNVKVDKLETLPQIVEQEWYTFLTKKGIKQYDFESDFERRLPGLINRYFRISKKRDDALPTIVFSLQDVSGYAIVNGTSNNISPEHEETCQVNLKLRLNASLIAPDGRVLRSVFSERKIDALISQTKYRFSNIIPESDKLLPKATESILLKILNDPGLLSELDLSHKSFLAKQSEKLEKNVYSDKMLAKLSGIQKAQKEKIALFETFSIAQMKGDGIQFGKFHALVLGNNDYQSLPNLKTAKNDAIEIAEILKNLYGFDVNLKLNATRSNILNALIDYRKKLTVHDNLLIYYAGHGYMDAGANEGYWLPVDAKNEIGGSNWLSNSSLTSSIRALKARRVMIVADSCYSGKLTRGLNVKENTPSFLAQLLSKKARVVLTSGGLEPVEDSSATDSIHSVFAESLIKVLSANNGVMDASEVFIKIRRPVMTNADQIPEYADIRKAGHNGGDFFFVRK
jgi:hypothetical protein